jgi:hypothetical protein
MHQNISEFSRARALAKLATPRTTSISLNIHNYYKKIIGEVEKSHTKEKFVQKN